MLRATVQFAVPDTVKALAVEKLFVARREADDGTALLAHQVIHCDANGVTEPTGLPDDLVGGEQLPFRRTTQFFNLRHGL